MIVLLTVAWLYYQVYYYYYYNYYANNDYTSTSAADITSCNDKQTTTGEIDK